MERDDQEFKAFIEAIARLDRPEGDYAKDVLRDPRTPVTLEDAADVVITDFVVRDARRRVLNAWCALAEVTPPRGSWSQVESDADEEDEA